MMTPVIAENLEKWRLAWHVTRMCQCRETDAGTPPSRHDSPATVSPLQQIGAGGGDGCFEGARPSVPPTRPSRSERRRDATRGTPSVRLEIAIGYEAAAKKVVKLSAAPRSAARIASAANGPSPSAPASVAAFASPSI
jgi:hypothetical protein